jgi:hypothetical protein
MAFELFCTVAPTLPLTLAVDQLAGGKTPRSLEASWAAEAEQRAATEREWRAKIENEECAVQNAIKPGTETHCGMVVQLRDPH